MPLNTRVCKIQLCSQREDDIHEVPMPLISVQIGQERLITQAFLDTRADSNIMMYKLYQQLKFVSLDPTQTNIQTFIGKTIKLKGVCTLALFVNELMCGDKFIVTQMGMQDIPLILGRAWQMRYNCFLNWERKLVHCQSGRNKQWVTLQTTSSSKNETHIKEKEKGQKFMTKQPVKSAQQFKAPQPKQQGSQDKATKQQGSKKMDTESFIGSKDSKHCYLGA